MSCAENQPRPPPRPLPIAATAAASIITDHTIERDEIPIIRNAATSRRCRVADDGYFVALDRMVGNDRSGGRCRAWKRPRRRPWLVLCATHQLALSWCLPNAARLCGCDV